MNETPETGGVPLAHGAAGEGGIMVDDSGNVVIGAPTAVAIVEYPNDGDPED